MINPLTTGLSIRVAEDAEDAVDKGFMYREPEYKAIEVKGVVVVKNGTSEGKSTVDFILEDATGQKFVFMITSRLLKSIPTEF